MRARITHTKLTSLKQKALRKRIWFKILDRAERAIVDLTIRVVERVRSSTLREMLMTISEKLIEALTSPVVKFTKAVGRPLAKKIARLALSWGNSEAHKWAEEPSFIRYLTIMQINTPGTFREP